MKFILLFGIVIGCLLPGFVGCRKVLSPADNTGQDALISFYGLSAQMQSELAFNGSSYVLIDNADSQYSPIPFGPLVPVFSSANKFQFPSTSFNTSLPESWATYQHLPSGVHEFLLTDTGHYVRQRTQLNCDPNQPTSFYYSDSLGNYQLLVLTDSVTVPGVSTAIRLINLSPDASHVLVTINEKPATGAGFTGIPAYGNTTGFVLYSNPVVDTLRINFYQDSTAGNPISRSLLQAKPGHAYSLALYGYVNGASYPDSKTTNYHFINPGVGVKINTNN